MPKGYDLIGSLSVCLCGLRASAFRFYQAARRSGKRERRTLNIEEGKLRLLEPLELAEHTVVQISLEAWQDDMERRAWLDEGQRSLMRGLG